MMKVTRSLVRTWVPQVAALLMLTALGVCHAQSGSFIIPTIRADGGTDFAYWDLFARPPGSTSSANYNYANPPALIDGSGEDEDGNLTTAFAPRTVLKQTGTPTAFITSSGAIYSFSAPLGIEVPYAAPPTTVGEITNVLFQAMTGGARLDVTSVFLRYQSGGQTVDLLPVYRALDDPQSGAFSERIISAFQWDLTGLDLRDFTIVFTGPTSMPLWEAQLDVVVGGSFEQEFGYLLATRARPQTRFGRPGSVDKNLPLTADGRFFLAGESLNLIGEPEPGWQASGWSYNGVVSTGGMLPLVFPAQDITVTALFAPLSYAAWRTAMFFHANALLETANDFSNDAISAPAVDHDGDGLSNAGEYAFAGDPYSPDQERTRPQLLLVEVEGQSFPAIRYRGNGLPVGGGDVVQTVRIAADGGAWTDNGQQSVTQEVARQLQADGSVLVTERTLQPLSAFSSLAMQVAWSVGGVAGVPQQPAALAVISESELVAAQQGSAYEVELVAAGGMAPYTWSHIGGGLPAGVTLAADGALSGLPQAGGSYSFTLQVEDALGSQVSRVFNLESAPYEISPIGLASVSVQTPYHQVLSVIGGSGPFVWSVIGGELPEGLSLSAAGVLSGTPMTPGVAGFTVQVVDANSLTTTRDIELTVVDLQIATPSPLPIAVVNRLYVLPMAASGGCAPFTWAVQSGALPMGIELSSSGVLSGTPLQAGDFSFGLRVEDADGYSLSAAFELPVSASLLAPVLSPLVFPDQQIGEEIALQVVAANYPERYLISGLPRGVRWNAKTGEIRGRPAVAGTFLVRVQAVNKAGSSVPLTAPLLVRSLPGALLGSFTALSERHAINGHLGSLVSLKTTATGAFTVSVRTGKGSKSARGFLNTASPQVEVEVAGAALALSMDPYTGALVGNHGGAAVTGWRATWDKTWNPASGREGYYSVAMELDVSADSLPQGVGFATFTVPANGLLRIRGKTADGQTIVSSGAMGPNGEIAIYAPQYANKGSVVGQWELAENADGLFSDNTISGELTWQKPETRGRAYADAFGPVGLNVAGRYLAPSASGQTVLGLPEFGDFGLEFSEGGIGESATVAGVAGIEWTEKFTALMPATGNAAGVKLRINKSTGAMNGTFTLTETMPRLVRKNVKFVGQVVRTADEEVRAVGYFLLPQLPAEGQRPTLTPILSGAVHAVQPTP